MGNKLLYTYFKPVLKEEHMLYANEIARMYGIVTRTGKPANTFVGAYLREISNKTKGYEQLYYSTQHGMNRVYPASLYRPAMNGLLERIGNEEACVTIENKNYYIKVEK